MKIPVPAEPTGHNPSAGPRFSLWRNWVSWAGLVIAVGSLFSFLLVSAVGSYSTYHYTESVQFCGRACHTVMEPERVTYEHGPHARVACVDCHNRPAHRFVPPERAVDRALALGQLDAAIACLKSNAVEALTRPYAGAVEARDQIATSLATRYPSDPRIRGVIPVIQRIYDDNFFPAMQAAWQDYPDNIGHLYWPGCFRCHDGKHRAENGGRPIKADNCNACHVILAQGNGAELLQLVAQGQPFRHPGEPYDPAFQCTDCHSASP